MTTFFNQFNFDPAETSVKTANYTIPAGKYARITPLYSTTASHSAANNNNATPPNVNIQLNSLVVYRFPVSGSLSNSSSVSRVITFPANGKCNVSVSANPLTPITLLINGASITPVSALGGDAFSYKAIASSVGMTASTGNATLVASWVFHENKTSFFAKEGDAITIAGTCAFLVEEYNKIL